MENDWLHLNIFDTQHGLYFFQNRLTQASRFIWELQSIKVIALIYLESKSIPAGR